MFVIGIVKLFTSCFVVSHKRCDERESDCRTFRESSFKDKEVDVCSLLCYTVIANKVGTCLYKISKLRYLKILLNIRLCTCNKLDSLLISNHNIFCRFDYINSDKHLVTDKGEKFLKKI